MTIIRSLYQRYKAYQGIRSDRVQTLPVAVLMPHSACNCRCVMCDIWKGNQHRRQLSEKDMEGMLTSFRNLGTRQVLLTGGEALVHPAFFELCAILRKQGLHLSLHTTGLTLAQHAAQLVNSVQDIIVSIDGDRELHNAIRRIPAAYEQLAQGIQAIRKLRPGFPISGRSVIHRWNFRKWPAIVRAAEELGLQRISFLPADTTSEAFNRPETWTADQQAAIIPTPEETAALVTVTEALIKTHATAIRSGFIAESPEKLRAIAAYYLAVHGQGAFPVKKCNAPWVSAVVEADGAVRPCFFHAAIGSVHQQSLEEAVNNDEAIAFRRGLNMAENPTCKRCVCSLYLAPGKKTV